MDVKKARVSFNNTVAAELVAQLPKGTRLRRTKGESARFGCFADDGRYVRVAGEQERKDADLALAYGLTECGDRRLILVLPKGWEFPTLQRAAWLRREKRPTIYVHDGKRVERQDTPTRKATIENAAGASGKFTPTKDLERASTPAHFGARTADVDELVSWAMEHPSLDPGHRKGERAWHYAGQKVLSIAGAKGGLRVTAGIHYTKAGEKPEPVFVRAGQPLVGRALKTIKSQVGVGIKRRRQGKKHPPDEHWLQAIIRREPTLAGVEQPALREVPAWRPTGGGKAWGRGFIDLLGLDGHGDLRIVETKLAKNKDELFIFQGLDYYVWAQSHPAGLCGEIQPDLNRAAAGAALEGAAEHAASAVEAAARDDEKRAMCLWRQVFGSVFPEPPGGCGSGSGPAFIPAAPKRKVVDAPQG